MISETKKTWYKKFKGLYGSQNRLTLRNESQLPCKGDIPDFEQFEINEDCEDAMQSIRMMLDQLDLEYPPEKTNSPIRIGCVKRYSPKYDNGLRLSTSDFGNWASIYPHVSSNNPP